MRKTVSGIMLTLLLISMLTLAFNIQPAKAIGTIYIRADGSIDPPTAPIQRDGTLYTLTGNITSQTNGIVIEKNDLVLDGEGFVIQGLPGGGYSRGVDLSYRSNVTIKNVKITGFGQAGIYLWFSSSNLIVGNDLSTNIYGIVGYQSNLTSIYENNLEGNTYGGIYLYSYHFLNRVFRNNMTANGAFGICSDFGLGVGSLDNDIYENNITAHYNRSISGFYGGISLRGRLNARIHDNNVVDNWCGVCLNSGRDNAIYNNNFVANVYQVRDVNWDVPGIYPSTNIWDDGYPSGGNYWSNYSGIDQNSGPNQDQPGSDGIGDTPHIIYTDNTDEYPSMLPLNGYRWPWGDDDSDGVLNYLDVPGLAVSTSQWKRRILGFDWSLAWSRNDGQINYSVMSTLYESWGINMPETRELGKHMAFAVLDSDALQSALYWLQTNAPNLVTQSFANSLTRHLCSDGHFRLLFFAHYDVDAEKMMHYLARIGKLLASPAPSDPENYLQALTAFSYWCNTFDVEIYQLEGVDSVHASLQFDWTDVARKVEALKLSFGDFSSAVGAVVDVVEMATLIIAPIVAPELFAVLFANALVKTLKFVLDLAAFGRLYTDNMIVDWIKTLLVAVDPPGEKLVLQLRDPATGALLLGYNSTSGVDVGAFPYGIYISEDDSALMILARDSANYNLTVTRNSTGSSLPYMLIVWDCEKNKTVTAGGFLESQQETSSNIRIESDALTMSYLQVHANFSTLTPDAGELVEVNITVTDNIGSPVDGLTVALHLNNERTFAQDLGEGRYQTQLDTSGMLGFYNVTIYTANPPSGFLQGMVTYPFEVGLHDVAVSRIDLMRSIVGQGFQLVMNLTVQNLGCYVEVFNVTVFANTTSVTSQNVTLSGKNSTVVALAWNTTGFVKGNYTISAYAEPVPDETYTTDNNATFSGLVLVTIAGDVTSKDGPPDGTCDMRDIGALCSKFMTTPSSPDWDPNYDINNDDRVDMRDIGIACDNYMKDP